MLALQNRAKNLEDAVKFKRAFDSDILPSQLIHKLNVATQAKNLYVKAHRMAVLLEETQDESTTADIAYIKHSLDKSLLRITDMIKILNYKANKFGAGEEKSEPLLQSQLNDFSNQDANMAYDDIDVDSLKAELRQSLKALSDIIEYMEAPTLLKIKKELNKLINY